MAFSETTFLFGFLPIALLGYFLCPERLKNPWLLVCSLAFYAYGEHVYSLVMLATIGFNYWAGRRMARFAVGDRRRSRFLGFAIALNLLVLGVFKYTNFLLENLSAIGVQFGFAPLRWDPVHLPIGVSFFTFQAMSYVIDVYREPRLVQHSPSKLALYIAMFPQLIAGPIVRYEPVAAALDRRKFRLDQVLQGAGVFIIGLGKKVLLADTFATHADTVFALPASDMYMDVAWLGAVSYALQIYFDFSGYSDMAVGLGRIFGFEFPQNFHYPYVARSVTDFWRRWHISLSSWFRDYLYIPLGGNRVSAARTYFNLWTVFLLCGLWHGAAWTFVIWGAWHGLLLVLERAGLGNLLRRSALLGWLYTWVAVLIGWVFFRATDLTQALLVLRGMVALAAPGPQVGNLGYYIDPWFALWFPVAVLSATPWWRLLVQRLVGLARVQFPLVGGGWPALRICFVGVVLLSSLVVISAGSYSPFIYFRF